MATDTVVLTDSQGNYYVLSQQLIERAKVTDPQQKAELERSVQAADTSGFSLFSPSFSTLSFGTNQFQLVGLCACNFQFNREGLIA